MAEEIDGDIQQFNATFKDSATGEERTVTFRKGEPVVYQPSHEAKPTLTRITYISKSFFVVAHSTTGRTIPFAETQNILCNIKLTLEEIEREVAWGVRKKDFDRCPFP